MNRLEKHKKYLSLLLTIGISISTSAQYVSDSVRHFDTTLLNNWKSEKVFQYKKGLLPTLSIWDRIKMWLFEMWRDLMSTETGVHTFWWIVIIASLLILFFFISKYTGKGTRMWSKKEKTDLSFDAVIEENIHEIPFEERIKQALLHHDYRLAIRLRYLYILKVLDDKNAIKWQAGKTNEDYVTDMRKNADEDAFLLFRKISIAFDFAWYGEHEVIEKDYLNVQDLFDQLNLYSFTTSKSLSNERI